MTAGLETYNTNSTVSHSATGSYGVFTAKYTIPGVGAGAAAFDYPIPGIYQRWLAGRTVVMMIGSGGAFSLDPKSNDTVSIYNFSAVRLQVMEW